MRLFKYNQFEHTNNKRITLNGTITPVSWNDKGEPTKFSLYTFDERDIPLISEGHFKKLKKNVNQAVEITGLMVEKPFEEDHLKIIKLKRKGSFPTPTGLAQSIDDFIYQDWPVRLPRHSINNSIGPSYSEVI